MPTPPALPVSVEGAALARSLQLGRAGLPSTSVSLALLVHGVLHFLTPPPLLGDASWRRLLAALRSDPANVDEGWRAVADEGEIAIPLSLQGRTLGVLLARRDSTGSAPRSAGFSEAERSLLHVIAQGVIAAAENGRLRANLVELLADYMSPEVASTLLADPSGQELGGQTKDVTVLFADLKGFTSFSERTHPAAVVALLNSYFSLAVPAIVAHGGTVSAFIGDAIMALFGAPHPHPEHPLQALRAALAMQRAIAEREEQADGRPQFRIGINTGPATVGNVGSPRRRVFTAIGDTVNLASRLEGIAPPGSVVVGEETYAVIRHFAEVRPMAPITVKGKAEPVRAYEVLRLREESERLIGTGTLTISADVLKGLQRGHT